MNKEEAISHGMEIHETKHSMKRRCPWHKYYRKGTYMLTLAVEGRKPLFGVLRGENPEQAHVELSPLGWTIREEEIKKIKLYYPLVEVWRLCIMPDHLHMIVHLKEDLPQGKHLGYVVRGFKAGCSKAWWKLEDACVETQGTVTENGIITVPSVSTEVKQTEAKQTEAKQTEAKQTEAKQTEVKQTEAKQTEAKQAADGKAPLFETGYNDKILFEDEQLDNWKHYLDDNPRRLWLKRRNPQFFTAIYDFLLAGRQCQIIGNRFLLDIPDKRAVIVHRRYSDEENARLRQEWLACGERGGVLVSAAIAPKEKAVLREAMDRGYRIILLRENGFPPLYKPSGEAFDACSEGRLLQISPWEFHMERATITRQQCLELNSMAEAIAGEK